MRLVRLLGLGAGAWRGPQAGEARPPAPREAREPARAVAADRLLLSERMLAMATQAAGMFAWTIDPVGRTMTWGDNAEAALGLAPGTLGPGLGDALALVHPEDRPRVETAISQAMAAGETFEIAFRIVDPASRSTVWLWSSGAPTEASADGGRVYSGLSRNVTEAREREAELQRAQRAAGLAPFTIDLRDNFRSSRSPEYLALHGVTPEGAHEGHDGWVARLHPDDRAAANARFLAAVAGDATHYEAEYRIVRPSDGETRWIAAYCEIERDPAGQALRLFGVHRDVTDRRAREEALAASERRLALALEGTSDGIWDWDLETGAVFHSPRFCAQLGYAPEEWESSYANWIAHMHPDDVGPVETLVRLYLSGEVDAYAPVFRMRHRDGSWRWMLSRARAFRDAEGRVRRMVGAHTDVTAHKEAEAALAESEARLRAANRDLAARVAEAVDARNRLWALGEDLFVTADFAGRLHEVSDSWTRALGWERDALLSMSWTEIVHPDDLPAVRDRLDALRRDGRAAAYENRVRAADGSWRLVAWTLAVTPERDRLYGVGRDVTHEREQARALSEAQRRLLEAQKTETIGRLTGGVAHDFNNLLSAILANLDLARKRIDDARAAQLVDGAVKAAERGASLTGRLLAFARRQDLKTEPVDVAGLFADMRDLLERSLGPAIDLRAEAAPGLPPVNVDRHQLEMALLNLAVNARDAMPEGGALTLGAETVTLAADERPDLAPGLYVRLRVADEGEGMDDATLARAAEPFFTTKEPGRGTGLGLSMVQGFVVQSGGALSIDSAPGQGAAVDLLLPAAAGRGERSPPPERAPAAAASSPSRGGARRTVLVVDDDALVAMGTVAMLEDLGHAVREAGSAIDALALLDADPAIDLVLTDHAMPGMTGLELARRIRALRPGLPVILVTGYADLPEGDKPLPPRLAKPFRESDLAALIAAL